MVPGQHFKSITEIKGMVIFILMVFILLLVPGGGETQDKGSKAEKNIT